MSDVLSNPCCDPNNGIYAERRVLVLRACGHVDEDYCVRYGVATTTCEVGSRVVTNTVTPAYRQYFPTPSPAQSCSDNTVVTGDPSACSGATETSYSGLRTIADLDTAARSALAAMPWVGDFSGITSFLSAASRDISPNLDVGIAEERFRLTSLVKGSGVRVKLTLYVGSPAVATDETEVVLMANTWLSTAATGDMAPTARYFSDWYNVPIPDAATCEVSQRYYRATYAFF